MHPIAYGVASRSAFSLVKITYILCIRILFFAPMQGPTGPLQVPRGPYGRAPFQSGAIELLRPP